MLFKYSSRKKIFNDGSNTGHELADLENFTLVELCIKSTIEPHEVPFEATFYVVEGSGTCLIENKSVSMNKGDVLTVGSGLKRGWEKVGPDNLILLAIRK